MREYKLITAGDLLPNQSFTFEDTPSATVFYALGVFTSFINLEQRETLITLSQDTTFNMPSGNALYLVRFPESIRADRLQIGDRIVDIDFSGIVTIDTILAINCPRDLLPNSVLGYDNDWVFADIGNARYHSYRPDTFVSVFRGDI